MRTYDDDDDHWYDSMIPICLPPIWTVNANSNEKFSGFKPPMIFDLDILDRYRLSLWQSILCNRVVNQRYTYRYPANYTYHQIDLKRQHVMVALLRGSSIEIVKKKKIIDHRTDWILNEINISFFKIIIEDFHRLHCFHFYVTFKKST